MLVFKLLVGLNVGNREHDADAAYIQTSEHPDAAEAKYILLVTELAGQCDLVVAALVVNLHSVVSQPFKNMQRPWCTHRPDTLLGEGLDELGRGVAAGLSKLRLLVLQLLLQF